MEKRISTLAVASVALRQWMGHHLWQWRDPLRIWVCLSGSCRRRRRASSSSNSIFKKAMPLFRNATQPLGEREKHSRGAQAACLPAYTSYHHRRHCGTPKGHTAATEGYVTNMLPRLSR